MDMKESFWIITNIFDTLFGLGYSCYGYVFWVEKIIVNGIKVDVVKVYTTFGRLGSVECNAW